MSTSEDLAALQASDPRVPVHTLAWIAEHRPDLRPQVAANPATPPDLLNRLASLRDPAVDAALFSRNASAAMYGKPTPPRRRFPLWARITTGVVGGVAVLGVGGWLLVDTVLFPRGASSPEAAVSAFGQAVDEQNAVDAYLLLAPDELDGLEESSRQLTERLADLDLGQGESATGSISIDGLTTEVHEISKDRAEVELTGGTITVRADAAEAAGRLLPVSATDSERTTTTFDLADAQDELGAPITVTVVREDGRWFISPLLTASGMAGDLSGNPTTPADVSDLDRTATSPQEAVRNLVQGSVDGDADGLAGALRTSQALPVLESAELLFDEDFVPVSELSDIETTVEEDGDRAVVTVTSAAATVDGQELAFAYADGCISLNDEPEVCAPDAQRPVMPEALRVVTVREDDGMWGVDLLQTATLLGADVLAADDAQILRAFGMATSLDPVASLAVDGQTTARRGDADYLTVAVEVSEPGTYLLSTGVSALDAEAAVVTDGVPTPIADVWADGSWVSFSAETAGEYRIALLPSDGESLPTELQLGLEPGTAAPQESGEESVEITGTYDWDLVDAVGFDEGAGYLEQTLDAPLPADLASSPTWVLQAPAGTPLELSLYDSEYTADTVLVVDGVEYRGDIWDQAVVSATGSLAIQVYKPGAAPGETFSLYVDSPAFFVTTPGAGV